MRAKEKIILFGGIFAYLMAVGVIVVLKHYYFQTQAWDLGIFDQLMWNTARGNIMRGTLEPLSNHFAVHFSPFLFFLVPGYAIFPSPYFLLLVQTAALALGAVPLYLTAKRILKTRFLALLLSLGYLIYPSLHSVNLFDFHPIAFAVPLFLTAFYFLEKKNWLWMGVFLGLAAFTQEEAIIGAGFVGLYLIFTKEKKAGLWVLGLSVLYFLLATKIIMPFAGGGLLRLDRYSQLGHNFSEIVKNVILHPSLFWETIWMWPKLTYIFWLFLPVAFMPVLARRQCILLAPGLAQNLLTMYTPQFSGAFQYDAVLIAGIFFSAVYGIKWLEDNGSTSSPSTKITCLKIILPVALLAGYFIHSPLSPFNFSQDAMFGSGGEREIFSRMVAKVPPGLSVSAATRLVPHLTGREYIYLLGQEPEPASPVGGSVDMVLFDNEDYFGFDTPEKFREHIQKYADSGKYGAEIIDDRYYILVKKDLLPAPAH